MIIPSEFDYLTMDTPSEVSITPITFPSSLCGRKIRAVYPLDKIKSIQLDKPLQIIKNNDCKCFYCNRRGTYIVLAGELKSSTLRYYVITDDFSLITIDHFIPKAKGGVDAMFNLVPACEECNSKKKDNLPKLDKNKLNELLQKNNLRPILLGEKTLHVKQGISFTFDEFVEGNLQNIRLDQLNSENTINYKKSKKESISPYVVARWKFKSLKYI